MKCEPTPMPLAIAVSLALATTAVRAEVLEEVIVTAQKRSESVQDLPISVTAFSGDQMKELGFASSIQLAAQTPGLITAQNNGEGNIATVSIRGVGLMDYSEHNESPSAVYVDEFYKANLSGLDFQLFDLDRAEVLRGPQGTLFGRNATGGLVHYITARPTQQNQGYAALTAGQFGELKAEGAVGGGITDTVSARLSAIYSGHDGINKNLYPGGKDGNALNLWGVRGQMLFEPAQGLSVLLKLEAGENDNDGGNPYAHQGLAPDPVTGLSVEAPTDFFGYSNDNRDPRSVEPNRRGSLNSKVQSGLLRVEWDVADMTLTSITGFEKLDKDFSQDPDASPVDVFNTTFKPRGEEITQELRLQGDGNRSRWVGGLYYMSYKNRGKQVGDVPVFGIVQDVSWDMDTDTWAAFGQYEYDIAPDWTAVAGLRYTQENKHMETIWDTVVPGVGVVDSAVFNQAAVGDLAKFDKDNVSYLARLNWKPSADLLLYASTSNAFKGGTFNLGFFAPTDADGLFDPTRVPVGQEELTSYETGFKSTILGGAARLNGAVFYYDYTDYQAFLFDGQTLTNYLFNNDANVKGGELELAASPADGWDIVLGASYLDAVVEDVADKGALVGGVTTVKDRPMPLAPHWSLNGLVRYGFAVPWGGEMSLQADMNYVGSQHFDPLGSPAMEQGSYTLGNVRVAWTSDDRRWTVAGAVQNVTDEAVIAYSFDLGDAIGVRQDVYVRPRWASFSVDYHW
ncbi:MAG: TonB-dependent receptor [Gammaproteobacteria bacterium]|nr:TonB-dependent receptor [Gammaproteobacteria bacterium]MDH5175081.1 TonB-dependent receptor [Gammaproteobacteria bacterium]